MNLFLKLLLFKIPTAHKVEQTFNRNREAYQKMLEIENSADYKEYLELNTILASDEYKERAKELKTLKFEDTPQGKQWEEFNRVTSFYTPDTEPDAVAIAKHHELKKIVESPEYLQFKETMEDPQRWEKSLEYKQAKRLESFQRDDKINFYLNAVKDPKLDFFRNWDLTFEDLFHGEKLNTEKWTASLPGTEFVVQNELSYYDECQAYAGESNLSFDFGQLSILTKHQKKLSTAWHPKQGFIQKDFEYTSGLISTRGRFEQQEGLFEAKIRSRGSVPLHHAFSLVAKNALPTVCIIKTGALKRYIVGQVYKEGGQVKSIQDLIKGLLFRGSGYFIFSLEWTKKELIWKINNFEVFRSNKNIPKEPLYLMLNSFVKEGKGTADGAFDVDWVRVFKRK